MAIAIEIRRSSSGGIFHSFTSIVIIAFAFCASALSLQTANAQTFEQGSSQLCIDQEIYSTSRMRRGSGDRIEQRSLRRQQTRYVCITGRYGGYGRGYYCRARFCGYTVNGRPVNGYFTGRGCFGERITCYGNIKHAVCR